MSARAKAVSEKDRFTFYMDLLGHDVLNNNQAVLSYLELISASRGVSKEAKTLAEKAVSHVRTSTVLIDNVKRLIASRDINPDMLRPADLAKSVDKAEMGLKRHFPAKTIRLEKVNLPKDALVLGDDFTDELVLNVLITLVRLNAGDTVNMRVTCTEGKVGGKPAWVMKVEDEESMLPPFLDDKGVSATYSQDVSTAVKTTGMLFSKMLANSLGGDFDAKAIRRHPRSGAVFTLTLRRSEGP